MEERVDSPLSAGGITPDSLGMNLVGGIQTPFVGTEEVNMTQCALGIISSTDQPGLVVDQEEGTVDKPDSGPPPLGQEHGQGNVAAGLGPGAPLMPNGQQLGYLVYNPEDQTLRVAIAQGTPVLVLANNNESGTFEANVMIDRPGAGQLMKLDNLQQFPQNNLGLMPDKQYSLQSHGLASKPEQTCHQSNMPVHKEKAHSGEEVFVCDIPGCGRSFSTLGYMKYHQAVHSGQKALRCNVEGCGRKFSWPAHLKYHQLTHTGERLHKCSVVGCNASFYTAQRLNVHLRTHTGEKPFECPEVGCNKSFTTAGNLKNHMRIHSGERPFLCPVEGCGRKFAEHSSLRKHKLVHSGEKPFICEICRKTFSQSGSRNVHMKRHELAKPEDTGSKDYLTDKDSLEPDDVMNTADVLVIRPSEDEILQYQDFQGTESVVFNAVADHVVTVTTQPADGDGDHLELPHSMLGSEEMTQQRGLNSSTGLPTTSGANVVVLSQPEEMVSMATGFHHHHDSQRGAQEIAYDSDLLHADLDQEELGSSLQGDRDTGPGASDHNTNMMDSLLASGGLGET